MTPDRPAGPLGESDDSSDGESTPNGPVTDDPNTSSGNPGAAKADQRWADADQVASDADQSASDADQAIADKSPADESPRSPNSLIDDAARQSRRSNTTERELTTVKRARTTRSRADRRSPNDPTSFELVTLEQIRDALNEGKFALFAQPIVDPWTDEVVQHELLVRMMGESPGELLLPGEFIPTAERFGLIAQIDRWVIKEALGLTASGYAAQVNVSGRTLADPGLLAFVEHELQAAGAEPSLFGFEVTETALIGNEELAVRFFDRVRDLGCAVAIDDFGSGYGGFSYLKRFRVDSLKIDREFVADLLSERASATVVRAIVLLADDLGLETVAEGVEDGETLAQLQALGVDFAQGYYFSRPAPVLEALAQTPTGAVGIE